LTANLLAFKSRRGTIGAFRPIIKVHSSKNGTTAELSVYELATRALGCPEFTASFAALCAICYRSGPFYHPEAILLALRLRLHVSPAFAAALCNISRRFVEAISEQSNKLKLMTTDLVSMPD
jgi:hypothetical protein